MKTNDKFINRILRKYLVPTILTILGTTITAFINSMIVGYKIGHDALAATNIISSFTFLFAMIGCLISIGASSAASVAIGKRDKEKVEKFTSFALVTSIVIPLIISAFIMLVIKGFMRMQGVDGVLYDLAYEYAKIMIPFGFLTTLMYYPFNFLRLDGRASQAAFIFGLMTALDIILVIVFVYAGFGLTGVGAAVMISTAVADAFGILYLFKDKKGTLKLKRFKISDIGWLSKDVWSRGSAAGLNNLCNMLRTMILNAWILKFYGADGAAVFAVACSVINLTSATVSGSGQTISPLVGVFYGERDSESLKMLMKSGVRYSVILHVVLLILAFPTATFLATAFGMRDPVLALEASSAIKWIFVSLIPAAILNVFIYYYSTLKKVVLSCTLVLMRALLCVLLFFALFIFSGHDDRLYSSFLLAESATLVFMAVVGLISGKKHSRKDGILYIDEMPEECYVSFSVDSSTEGAVEASRRMTEFCNEHNVDSKYKSFLSMALEELLIIIDEQCLKGAAEEYVDVRIYMDEDGLILRARYGGIKFDPMAWYIDKCNTMSYEDMLLDDALGMKMIVGKSTDIYYQNTFGTNNLVVVL